jgi:hypothetical protein
VATGLESTDRVVHGSRQAARGTQDIPSVPILTSDVYEWEPGGFFVVHSAYGNVHTSSVEITGDVIRWLGERRRCTATLTVVALRRHTTNRVPTASPGAGRWKSLCERRPDPQSESRARWLE